MCQSLVWLNKSKSLPFNPDLQALNDTGASVSEQSPAGVLKGYCHYLSWNLSL